ncbi:MAG: hypothetical protein LC804_16665, partial [Acidobacteria bacterium]|nr:hypothetical protein [Acidobacteriota bacterium]
MEPTISESSREIDAQDAWIISASADGCQHPFVGFGGCGGFRMFPVGGRDGENHVYGDRTRWAATLCRSTDRGSRENCSPILRWRQETMAPRPDLPAAVLNSLRVRITGVL